MEAPSTPPDVAFVRVRTAAGPYREGDILTVAFARPEIGRLAAHDFARGSVVPHAGSPIVPESLSADVVTGAGPYARGDRVTLSFVDPNVARIHPVERYAKTFDAEPHAQAVDVEPHAQTVEAERRVVEAMPVARTFAVEQSLERDAPSLPQRTALRERGVSFERPGVRVRLSWDVERSRRFIAVCDKLFTVDRLGWYRHALATRLLVPDEISTGDDVADLEATRHLQALRAAAIDALGRPLLAACMPGFAVTADWLDALDGASALRAAGGLRDAILPYVEGYDSVEAAALGTTETLGVVTRDDVAASSSGSLDALLPMLIPCRSSDPAFGEALSEYRRALAEAFGQTADAVDAVRLNAMAQPNHALDDRLWRLVGAVGSLNADSRN